MSLGPEILIACMAVLFYVHLKRRLNIALQPARLEMAEIGQALLADGRLKQDQRLLVEFYLDTCFDRWTTVAWLICAPVVVLCLLFSRRYRQTARARWVVEDADVRARFERVAELYNMTRWAASPLLTLLQRIEQICLQIIALSALPLYFGELRVISSGAVAEHHRHPHAVCAAA